MAALHDRDFEGLIAVLDPDVIVRVDETAGRAGLLKRLGARSPLRGRLGARKRCSWIAPRAHFSAPRTSLGAQRYLVIGGTIVVAEGKIVPGVFPGPALLGAGKRWGFHD